MLYHVAANFDRGGVETIVISADNVYNLPALSKDEAKKKMENILSLYKEGLCEPFFFDSFSRHLFLVSRQ